MDFSTPSFGSTHKGFHAAPQILRPDTPEHPLSHRSSEDQRNSRGESVAEWMYSTPRTQSSRLNKEGIGGFFEGLKTDEQRNAEFYNIGTRTEQEPSRNETGYQRALSGVATFPTIVSSKSLAKEVGEFSVTEASIGHSNALKLREELRVDLHALDLLCSDIALFRQKHVGAEMQRMKQRSGQINQWTKAFQDWFSEKATLIMNNADDIRRDQQTLADDVKEQYLVAQSSVENLERQVSEFSAQIQADGNRAEIELASLNQRKERLERQLRSLHAKKITDADMHREALEAGASAIEQMQQQVHDVEKEVFARKVDFRHVDVLHRERFMMLVSDKDSQRERLSSQCMVGVWETRFMKLVEQSLPKPDEGPNPVRTAMREPAWDEIENLEHDLRMMDKSADPLRVALEQIVEAEAGDAKMGLVQLRNLYDQTLVVRQVNTSVQSAFRALSIRHPELFCKMPTELVVEENETEALSKLPVKEEKINRLPSAKRTQEKTRYQKKLSRSLAKRDDNDLSFLTSANKRFDRSVLDSVADETADLALTDIILGPTKLAGKANRIDFPRAPEKNEPAVSWATFGETWFDA